MSYRSEILTDTPTLDYEHQEAAGLVMADLSGGSKDGAYAASGVTYNQDGPLVSEVGRAVVFDGSAGRGSYTGLSAGDRPTYPFCLEAWARPSSASAGDIVVLIADGVGQEVAKVMVGTPGTVWGMGVANLGGGEDTVATTVALVDAAWQHLFARFVGPAERYLYQDGVQVAGGNGLNAIAWTGTNTATYGLFIGSTDQAAALIPARLFGSAFYNHDVTATRILEHYQTAVAVENVLYRGVDAKLMANATVLSQTSGRVHADQMPTNTELPGVRYALLVDSPHDRLASGAHFTAQLQVDVYTTRGDDGSAWTIDSAVRAALDRQDLSIVGFNRVHAKCTDRGVPLKEGGFYRIRSTYRLFGTAA